MAKPADKIREFYRRYSAVGEFPVYAQNGAIATYTENEHTAIAHLCSLLYGVNPPVTPVERPGVFSHRVKSTGLDIDVTIGFIPTEYNSHDL